MHIKFISCAFTSIWDFNSVTMQSNPSTWASFLDNFLNRLDSTSSFSFLKLCKTAKVYLITNKNLIYLSIPTSTKELISSWPSTTFRNSPISLSAAPFWNGYTKTRLQINIKDIKIVNEPFVINQRALLATWSTWFSSWRTFRPMRKLFL